MRELTSNEQQHIELFKSFAKLNGIVAEPVLQQSDAVQNPGGQAPDVRLVYTNDLGATDPVSIMLMIDFNSEEYEMKELLQHFGKPPVIQVGWLRFTGQETQQPQMMYQITDPPVPVSSVGPPIGDHLPGHFRVMHGDPEEGATLTENGKSYVCVSFGMFFRCWRLL